jgi:predicted nuclease of predicted toxin-antitoxin system
MTLQLLVDMNLSPEWVPVLAQGGRQAVHWSTIGDPRASDRTLFDWAFEHSHIVFTHDLDFGALLALTHAKGPSVIQVRALDVLPEQLGPAVISVLHRHESELASGALIVIDPLASRIRLLPL